MVDIQDLFDAAKCYQTIREMRRPDGVTWGPSNIGPETSLNTTP
jgi:hypothetical protein